MYAFIKRTFDIVSSFLAIILLSLLLIVLALLVKLSSKGPVLFKDVRVGKKGKTIKVLKFRSMYIDAEERLEKYLTPEEIEAWEKERKITNDPRITKVGKFLRKTSLDELPQLFNILFGSMSVVGPRPITKKELDDNYTADEQKLLLSARPGLISNWGVNGRSEVLFSDGKRQQLELEYFKKRSLWYDLKLIFKAIGVVFSSKGAS
ncbi:MAG: sugar transferase [Bacilli bacterium]|nr:sugar transferase [Bacilli bacterium]